MGFMDLLKTEQSKSVGGTRCAVCAFVDTLPDKDAKEFQAGLDDKKFSHSSIVRASIAEFGVRLNPQSVARHRKKLCVTIT